jgi:DNA-binding transcriptional ArsR family regulator
MSDVSEKDIKEIKWKVEGIDKSIDLLVRANRKEIINDIMQFFGKSKERVRVFLEIEGEKTVGQLSDSLGIKTENVSRRLTELTDEGLIRVKKVTRAGKVYEKTDKVKVLNLEKLLRKEFKIAETQSEKKIDSPDEKATEKAGEEPEK